MEKWQEIFLCIVLASWFHIAKPIWTAFLKYVLLWDSTVLWFGGIFGIVHVCDFFIIWELPEDGRESWPKHVASMQ
jgi:hypothetical protein